MIELRRGDVVLYGERGEFTGKVRPGIVVQHDATLLEAPSVTLCGLTSLPMPSHASRVAVSPSPENGIDRPCYVMIDKVVSIGRVRVREKFGRLSQDEIAAVDEALRHWLDL